MGQGYSAIHPSAAATAGLDAPELADLDFESSLAGARFLKTVRARNKNGLVAVKIYTKPYASLSLTDRINALCSERHRLTDVPNALPYHRIVETPTAAYVVRQFIASSLYDRISTNPPLEDIERRWIAFQLLCALRDCHVRNVLHGDLKSENLLLTSWNWLYLSDFSSCIKPHFLPEDNPADFTLFYDTTARRVCYIAPERFVKSSLSSDGAARQEPFGNLQWTADIFSAGCVIAELFTEKPTFTLAQLFRYRKGDYDPLPTLAQDISNPDIRDLVTHMIQLDPADRYSAGEYLDFWRAKAFPPYFYDFLHQYTHLITDPFSGQKPVVAGDTNNAESDDRIDRVYYDFDKIAVALDFNPSDRVRARSEREGRWALGVALDSLVIDLPDNCMVAKRRSEPTPDNGALLFSSIVTASVRSVARARSKLRACELLLALGEQLTDEARLDRLLPFAMTLLDDDAVAVKMTAIRTVTHLLSLVSVLSPINAFIFPRYILPRLQRVVASPSYVQHPPVRAVHAACLATLATTAARFLHLTQAFRVHGSLPSVDPEAEDDVAADAAYLTSYDVARDELFRQFAAQTKAFLTDEDPAVRRAFLASVPDLCVFFGDTLAADLILTHLNTYLNNNQDWTLKCALFETIVGVAAYVGGDNLENFILPLIVQALPDTEETVTEQAMRALSAMAHLGLFNRPTTLSLLNILSRFALHPNPWIREATAQFVSSSISHLSRSDIRSLVAPLVAPVLKISSADMTETDLLDTFKKPLPRVVLDVAKVWAGRHEKSNFWKAAKTSRALLFDPTGNWSIVPPLDDTGGMSSLGRLATTEEDGQWIGRLRHAGLKSDDEPTLALLRDYIYLNTMRAAKTPAEDVASLFDRIVSLTTLNIPLQNILFEDEASFYDQIATKMSPDTPAPSMSLAEALNDAAKASSGSGVDPGRLGARIDGIVSSDKTPAPSPQIPPPIVAPADARRPSSIAFSESSARDAFSLMRPGSAARKAIAETGTDSVTVTGKLDIPSGRMTNPRLGMSERPPPTPAQQSQGTRTAQAPARGAGSLNDFGLSHFSVEAAEFGPFVETVERPPAGTMSSQGRWKPHGRIVAAIGEHTAQITRIAVSPDHVFFVTGSRDGSIRVWDTSRLERNVTHRSRQVHRHSGGAAVSGICFVDRTHTFISAAADGSVNVVRVDVSDVSGTPRYGKLQVLREWTIPKHKSETVSAIELEHHRDDNRSMCLMLTSDCSVLAVDPASMEIVYRLSNPPEHGTPTSFCVHRRRQWLVVATSHGVLDLWDLRFRLLLRSWTFPSPASISQITLHPSRRSSHRARICIAGGTAPDHVSIWDLEKQACTELFRVAVAGETSDGPIRARDLHLVPLGQTPAAAATTTIGTSQPANAVGAPATGVPSPESGAVVRAFTIQMHPCADQDSESRFAFLVSAGPDLRLRFWDSIERAGSGGGGTVNGCFLGGAGAGGVGDALTTPGSVGSGEASIVVDSLGAETRVFTETSGVESSGVGAGAGVATAGAKTKTGSGSASGSKLSRYEIIRASARGLLSSHADGITCLAFVQRPFEMVVSADRSGMMYIFQ